MTQSGAPSRYRWVVLGAGTIAQGSTAAIFLGLASVTPLLRSTYHLSVPGVGVLLGVISAGILLTLLPWGLLTDRVGERPVMVAGLLGASAALWALPLTRSAGPAAVLLLLTGAAGASVNAASGRAVLTWFPRRGRGLAMGVRQSSTPLGAAAAAAVLPTLGGSYGLDAVYHALAAVCLGSAVLVAATIHEPRDAAPRATGRGRLRVVLAHRGLWRLSLASGLLVVPQLTVGALLVEYLHDAKGMAVAAAAAVLAAAQFTSAGARLVVGAWSDHVGSRVGPLHTVGLATAGCFLLVAVLDRTIQSGSFGVLAPVLVLATVLATCWNGLAFTLAGEIAPPGQGAAAMSLQNSANYLAAALTPVLAGAVAAQLSWTVVFLLAGLAAVGSATLLRHGLRIESTLHPTASAG